MVAGKAYTPRPAGGCDGGSGDCPAGITMPPGSEVILNANFVSTGEDCPRPQYYPESITAPGYSYSANGQSNPQYFMYVSGGCSGIAGNFNFVPIANDNVSFYAGPEQDGGASWALSVEFNAAPDAGACQIDSCVNLYVGNNQKL